MWREREEQGKMNEHDKMERKTFSGFVTKADDAQGIIEAFFAVMGNVDLGVDIIHPGAFTKTFAERGLDVRVLDNHRTDTIMRVIGKPLFFKEVTRDELPPELLEKHSDANGGAFARVQMLMDTPEGKGAFVRLREGAVTQWSFDYDALDIDFSTVIKDGEQINVRNLRTLKLYEISPVIFGMNEATQTVSAKSDDKGVSGATNLPLAPRARAWDAAAARGRVRSFTGSQEAPSASYRRAFFWFNGDAPDNFGSYKLPFADVIDGKLTAIPRGVFAGAQRLDGTDIPASDKEGVRSRMSTYYAKMRREFDDDSLVPPWDKEGDGFDESKIGRVISAATGKRIQGAIDGIQSALGSLEKMLIDAGVTAAPTGNEDESEEDEKSAPAKQAALEEQSKKAGPQTAPTSEEMLERIKLHLQELGG